MESVHRQALAEALRAKGHGAICVQDVVDALKAQNLVVMEAPIEQLNGRNAFNLVARAESELKDLLYGVKRGYADAVRMRANKVTNLMTLVTLLADRGLEPQEDA